MTLNLRNSLLALLAAAATSLAATASATDAAPAAQPSATPQPMMVSTDSIVAVPAAQAWTLLSDSASWSAWNKNVSAVAQASLSLTAGAAFSYQWQGATVSAAVVEEKDNESLTWKGAKTGADVSLRWTLKPKDAGHTLVILSAVLKPDAPQAQQTLAFSETQAWMDAFQAEALRRAPAPTPVPTPAAKKRRHKAAAAPKAATPTAATGA